MPPNGSARRPQVDCSGLTATARCHSPRSCRDGGRGAPAGRGIRPRDEVEAFSLPGAATVSPVPGATTMWGPFRLTLSIMTSVYSGVAVPAATSRSPAARMAACQSGAVASNRIAATGRMSVRSITAESSVVAGMRRFSVLPRRYLIPGGYSPLLDQAVTCSHSLRRSSIVRMACWAASME